MACLRGFYANKISMRSPCVSISGKILGFLNIPDPFNGRQILTNLGAVVGERHRVGDYLPYVIAAPLVSVWAFMLDGIFIGAVATAEMRNAMIIMLVLAVGVGELLIHTLGLLCRRHACLIESIPHGSCRHGSRFGPFTPTSPTPALPTPSHPDPTNPCTNSPP